MELNNTKLKKTTEEMKDILNSIIWIIVITIAAAVSLNLSALAAAMTGGFLPEPVMHYLFYLVNAEELNIATLIC